MEPQELYRKQMLEIIKRITILKYTIEGTQQFNRDQQKIEFSYLQLRKILELVAFSSIVPNKEKYSKAHNNFFKHYRTIDILDVVEKINPDFYPKPLEINFGEESRHTATSKDANIDGELTPLTKKEFKELYKICSKVIHIPNPYDKNKDTIDLIYDIDTWLRKICSLLDRHMIKFADSSDCWMVIMNAGNNSPMVISMSPKESS